MIAPPPEAGGPMPRIAALLADELRETGCEVATAPWGSHSRLSAAGRVRACLADIRRVRRTLARDRPDLLLVQTSHEPVSLARDLALVVATRRCVPKTVLEFHGGYSTDLTAPGRRVFKLASAALLRLTDGVLVLSSEERRALQAFHPHGSFHTITNPFQPLPEGEASPAGAREGEPVVLFVSRLVREKGIFEAAAAVDRLSRRLPCRLVVAGDGPAAAELRGWAGRETLNGRLTLLGHVTSERLAAAYRAADVFVLPTYHPEGFPTSLSEAMSCGLPIVTTSVRGIPDHLSEETNALFVPPRDIAALERALERLLTDPALCRRMSEANRAKVADFSPAAVVGGYVRAFDAILAG